MSDWDWTKNPIMEWSNDGGGTWSTISDHGRSPLSVSIERIENKQRMASGTLRRYVVAKKKTWSVSWDNFPDKAVEFLANGQPGEWMETFHDKQDEPFLMRLRAGSDWAFNSDTDEEFGLEYTVMISDFSKEIVRRGKTFDLWTMDMTLEEV